MSAILKSDFQKRKQLRFPEVNYLNYTKRPNFACGNYIFPKTRGNKNKPWTHSTSLNACTNIGDQRMKNQRPIHIFPSQPTPHSLEDKDIIQDKWFERGIKEKAMNKT